MSHTCEQDFGARGPGGWSFIFPNFVIVAGAERNSRKAWRGTLSQLEPVGRQEPTEALAAKATRLKQKLAKLEEEMAKLAAYEKQMLASSDQQISSPIPTVARWRRAGAVRASSAATSRWQLRPSII